MDESEGTGRGARWFDPMNSELASYQPHKPYSAASHHPDRNTKGPAPAPSVLNANFSRTMTRSRRGGKRQPARRRAHMAVSISEPVPASDVIVTPAPVSEYRNPVSLPEEILWCIFSIFLFSTKWTGWSKLLRLDKGIYERILTDTTLIRNTLPVLRGGCIRTLEWLSSKMPTVLERRRPLLCVVNGVASGLEFFDDDLREKLRKIDVLYHNFSGLFYVDIITIVTSFNLLAEVPVKAFGRILRELKHLKGVSGKEEEYARYVLLTAEANGAIIKHLCQIEIPHNSSTCGS